MDSEREDLTGRVPLPGFGDPASPGQPAPTRSDGIRRVRRMSNWTLAALIAGTGAATVALAHNASPGAATSAGTAPVGGASAASTTNGATGPQVTHSVATTSGSGVVTTTTTTTANGKVTVTHVRHTTNQDN
jgi:hypothetical protein